MEIPRAIFDSDVILVCLSKNSINKEGYVQKEILFALDKAMEKPDGTIFIVPVKLEECDVPQRLNRYQWVDLYREDGRKRLMLGLNKRAAQLGPAVEQAIVSDDTLEREKMELETKEKLAREKTERDAAQKAEREKIELEAREKFVRENTEREALANAAREKEEREKDEKIAHEPVGRVSNPTDTWNEKASRTESPTYEYTEPKKPAAKVFPVALGSFGLLLIVGFLVVVAINLPTSAQPTPTLDIAFSIGSTMTGEDGATLVYVPEGKFTMGSDSSDQSDERPEHQVDLSAFWIDQIEVTNKQYAACVSDAGCTPPSNTSSYTRSSYYGAAQFDEFPVIYVNWSQANAYCSWAGRELPTEAQWEKAARGTDINIYPWGNDTPNKDLLNYNSNVGDTTKTGSYETGKSIYGAYDMAGNVWEWVNDWYSETYYQSSPSSNPLGPYAGQSRVLRSGSWFDFDFNVRSAGRYGYDPTYTYNFIGFCCSRSP